MEAVLLKLTATACKVDVLFPETLTVFAALFAAEYAFTAVSYASFTALGEAAR